MTCGMIHIENTLDMPGSQQNLICITNFIEIHWNFRPLNLCQACLLPTDQSQNIWEEKNGEFYI